MRRTRRWWHRLKIGTFVAEYGSATRLAAPGWWFLLYQRTSSLRQRKTRRQPRVRRKPIKTAPTLRTKWKCLLKMKMRNKIASTKQLSLPYTVGLTRVQPTVARENFYFSFEFFLQSFVFFLTTFLIFNQFNFYFHDVTPDNTLSSRIISWPEKQGCVIPGDTQKCESHVTSSSPGSHSWLTCHYRDVTVREWTVTVDWPLREIPLAVHRQTANNAVCHN